jgi:GTPase-activating protein SAC7
MRMKHENTFLGDRMQAKQEETVVEPNGIFGVPLRQSIVYANVAISLVDADGKSYIYGYVPIVVAKCGVFLKEKGESLTSLLLLLDAVNRCVATNVEGIFRLSGAEKRIKELVVIFNTPDRYGKGLDWNGYTVHDAANVLRRYLNQLPEPIVPLDLYDRFRDPLRGHALEAVGDQEASQALEDFDLQKTIAEYQQLITELPPLNRQLLLYILDLLAVFASKSEENRMPSQNLAAIFQPGMLSHPAHDMAPAEYRLSQNVLVFLIENQDNFLIGMSGTAADEKTVSDVQNGGTPPISAPNTPKPSKGNNTIGRSASNASAGAESLRKQGGVRRNLSVNSRHSRQSNGAPSPASPALGGSMAQNGSGVHRSNTVPSKKSPGLSSNRLQKSSVDGRSPTSPSFQQGPVSPSEVPAAPVVAPAEHDVSPVPSPSFNPSVPDTASLAAASHGAAAAQSQDRLLLDPTETRPDVVTPGKERRFFQRSPTTESDPRHPNKLRKKRINSSSNPSAQSSTHSLQGQSANASPGIATTQPNQEISEFPHLSSIPSSEPAISHTDASPITEQQNVTHLTRPEGVHQSSDGTLKPQNSSHSLRSRGESFHEASDIDVTDDPVALAEKKEKKHRWTLTRKKDESLGASLSPKKNIGSNGGAETSTTSFSSSRARKSFTGDTVPVGSDSSMIFPHQQTSNDTGPSHDSSGKEEKKGPIDWLKRKMQEAKEEKREREAEKERERAGKGMDEYGVTTPGIRETLRKSMDMRRPTEKNSTEKGRENPGAPAAPPGGV